MLGLSCAWRRLGKLGDWPHILRRYWRGTKAGLSAAQVATLVAQGLADDKQRQQYCLAILRQSDASLILPLAWHADGFIRAAVLQRLADSPHPSFIPAIVARLNDWVPEVRLAARLAVGTHLRTAFLPEWLKCWPQIRGLYHCQRAVHRLLVIEIENWLMLRPHHAKVCQGLQSDNKILARECFRLVAQAAMLPQEELIRLALCSSDHLVAGCAPAWICSLPDASRASLLSLGRQVAIPQVRQVCRRMLLQHTTQMGAGKNCKSHVSI